MIHPTAVIGPQVTLGQRVAVGPYTVIDGAVSLGDECQIGPHCHLTGHTTIGARTRIHHGAVIGDLPQDYDFKDTLSYTRIGSDCVLREYVTVHRGTKEASTTSIGDHCMLMAFVHVAHNCQIADRVVIVNNSLLAGYVEVGYRAILSGDIGVHQFVRIGAYAMLAGKTRLTRDVAPFCLMADDAIYGPNTVGLRRAGFDSKTRTAIRQIVKTYFFSGLLHQAALEQIEREYPELEQAQFFAQFARASKRGLVPGTRHAPAPSEE